MTTAQVVETSVTVTNSSFQNYTHPDDHTTRTTIHTVPLTKRHHNNRSQGLWSDYLQLTQTNKFQDPPRTPLKNFRTPHFLLHPPPPQLKFWLVPKNREKSKCWCCDRNLPVVGVKCWMVGENLRNLMTFMVFYVFFGTSKGGSTTTGIEKVYPKRKGTTCQNNSLRY